MENFGSYLEVEKKDERVLRKLQLNSQVASSLPAKSCSYMRKEKMKRRGAFVPWQRMKKIVTCRTSAMADRCCRACSPDPNWSLVNGNSWSLADGQNPALDQTRMSGIGDSCHSTRISLNDRYPKRTFQAEPGSTVR